MNYKNCECKAENVIPCEGSESGHDKYMTESVQEIKGIAEEIAAIAHRLNSHMFGNEFATPIGSSNKKEATCLDDDIENIRSLLLETAKILHDTCYKTGC